MNFDQETSPGVDRIWHYGFLFAPALTLGGGTFAVQAQHHRRDGARPAREPDVEKGMTWSETKSK